MRVFFCVLFFYIVSGCMSIGLSCSKSADCCGDACSPTSCVDGVCVGSTCLTFGSPCGLDCQCCSGYCDIDIDNNPRCSVPVKNKDAALDDACCYDNNDGYYCKICCPLGSPAICTLQGGCSCGKAMSLVCQGQSVQFQAIGNSTVVSISNGMMAHCNDDEKGCEFHCRFQQKTDDTPHYWAIWLGVGGALVVIAASVIVVVLWKRRKMQYNEIV